MMKPVAWKENQKITMDELLAQELLEDELWFAKQEELIHAGHPTPDLCWVTTENVSS